LCQNLSFYKVHFVKIGTDNLFYKLTLCSLRREQERIARKVSIPVSRIHVIHNIPQNSIVLLSSSSASFLLVSLVFFLLLHLKLKSSPSLSERPTSSSSKKSCRCLFLVNCCVQKFQNLFHCFFTRTKISHRINPLSPFPEPIVPLIPNSLDLYPRYSGRFLL